MLGQEKVLVVYNSPYVTGKKLDISLCIANELGYVNDVKALFNNYGHEPGSEAKVFLDYDEKKSVSGEYSVFTGNVVFHDPGYKTFYIYLKINGISKVITWNSKDNKAVLSDSYEGHEFWRLFVTSCYFETPSWVYGKIMYQIYVDTFYCKDPTNEVKEKVVSWNSFPYWKPNDDGDYFQCHFYGGNLKGIIDKLPYIKSLNVGILYLTPVFKSPSQNRYDISDYEQIDDMVGTWEELDELHKKANEMGIKLVLDVVFNHSSNQNAMFKNDPDMYEWEIPGVKPKTWWGFKGLVEFNQFTEKYQKFLKKTLLLYCDYCDGFRFDVADSLHSHSRRYARIVVSEYLSEMLLLGEVWKNGVIGDFKSFYNGYEIDGQMNYQYANAIYRYIRWGKVEYFKKVIRDTWNLYPHNALACSPIFLSSHDIPRIPNILVGDFMREDERYENVWTMEEDDYWKDENNQFDTLKFRTWEFEHDQIPDDKKELAWNLQKVSVFMQYTLPGLPSVFAGDEVGVMGYKDPFNRKPFPWDNMDQEKLSFYRNMGECRSKFFDEFASIDNFNLVECDESKVVYSRGDILCIVNRTGESVDVSKYQSYEVAYSMNGTFQKDDYTLGMYDAVIFKK